MFQYVLCLYIYLKYRGEKFGNWQLDCRHRWSVWMYGILRWHPCEPRFRWQAVLVLAPSCCKSPELIPPMLLLIQKRWIFLFYIWDIIAEMIHFLQLRIVNGRLDTFALFEELTPETDYIISGFVIQGNVQSPPISVPAQTGQEYYHASYILPRPSHILITGILEYVFLFHKWKLHYFIAMSSPSQAFIFHYRFIVCTYHVVIFQAV